jgi:hypothetical protein
MPKFLIESGEHVDGEMRYWWRLVDDGFVIAKSPRQYFHLSDAVTAAREVQELAPKAKLKT